MVRNDIQNQPHPRLFQRRRHAVKPFPPANRRVDFVGVGHVIAVGGIRGCGENR